MRPIFTLTNHQLMSLGINSFLGVESEEKVWKADVSHQRWVAGRH